MKPLLLALLAVSSVMADMITLTMDEVPQQFINGLTVSKGGENFTFSDPGGTMQYDFVVPGTQEFLTNPGIAGGVEPFGVSFSTPVDSVQFGMAESSVDFLPGVGITLYDDASVVLSTTMDLVVTGHPAVENLFTWWGQPGQEITSMQITPASIVDPIVTPNGPIFLAGIDNLSVDLPEPSSLSLSLLAAAGLLVFGRSFASEKIGK